MKNLLIVVFFAIMACGEKTKIRSEVSVHLNKAMSAYLYDKVHNDSSKVKYDVQEVIFFEDATFYECEFKVRVQSTGKDTTGIMKARVSKDFTHVNRES